MVDGCFLERGCFLIQADHSLNKVKKNQRIIFLMFKIKRFKCNFACSEFIYFCERKETEPKWLFAIHVTAKYRTSRTFTLIGILAIVQTA